jgi:hypothetical protein
MAMSLHVGTNISQSLRFLYRGSDNASKVKKSKAVPLHAMEAHGGRGGIAPTHS